MNLNVEVNDIFIVVVLFVGVSYGVVQFFECFFVFLLWQCSRVEGIQCVENIIFILVFEFGEVQVWWDCVVSIWGFGMEICGRVDD